MPDVTPPRYRKHDWIDTEMFQPLYGIQVSVTKRKWLHLSRGGKPMLYATQAQRDAAIASLRK